MRIPGNVKTEPWRLHRYGLLDRESETHSVCSSACISIMRCTAPRQASAAAAAGGGSHRVPRVACRLSLAPSNQTAGGSEPTDVLSLLVQQLRDSVQVERARAARFELLLGREREEALLAARIQAEAAGRERAALEAQVLAERRDSLATSRAAHAQVAATRREMQEMLIAERALHTAATAAAAREAAAHSAELVRRLEEERKRVRELEQAMALLRMSSGELSAQARRLSDLRRSTAAALRGEESSGADEEGPGAAAQQLREALARESAARSDVSSLRAALEEARAALEAERSLRLSAEDDLVAAYVTMQQQPS